MTREEFVLLLEKENGNCSCPDLLQIVIGKKEVRGLEAKCTFFEGNVDLKNPVQGDQNILRDYKQAVKDLKETGERYHARLANAINGGQLRLMAHYAGDENPTTEVDYETARELSKKENVLITANCGSCNRQIDVLDYL